MKKILLIVSIIFAATTVLAVDLGTNQAFQISKNKYSKNMFLILECLSTKGLTDNFRVGDLALEHCKGEAFATAQIGSVYNNLPSPIDIELSNYHHSLSDMVVCLGGVRGIKTSEDESQQRAQDQTALKECESLLIPVGGSASISGSIETP